MKIGVVGVGVMGEIIVASLLKKEIVMPENVLAYDVHKERLSEMRSKYAIAGASSIKSLSLSVDVIILATKPQNAEEVFRELKGKLKVHQLVVSIMAGISRTLLTQGLAHHRIIRSMPNLAAKISQGMTVWIAGNKVHNADRMMAKMIFQSFGREFEVSDEDRLDAATAVSGSGPAYVYYLAEALMEAAIELQFSAEEALKMVHQTFLGAMELWAETEEAPALLRQKVTSKKGTTDAAVKKFEKNGLKQKFKDGVRAAYQRSRELGNEKKK